MRQHETVTLLLRGVVFRHTDYRSLEEYLIEKYRFRKVEEKEQVILENRHIVPADYNKRMIFDEEARTPIMLEGSEGKFSTLKIYEGEYLDAKIYIYVMGEVTQREDMVAEASGEEQNLIYTSIYQLIKLVSSSGYALQQLIERLTIDLGLDIKSKEWVFHRGMEA